MMIISPAIQPLQFSLNFPDLNIGIDLAMVSVVLKKNGTIVLQEEYINGPTGSFDLKLNKLLHSLLAPAYAGTAAVEEATANLATFSLEIESEAPVTFKALKGGVNIENFATQANYAIGYCDANWLSWQPTVREVTSLLNQTITFYATADCSLIYLVSGGTPQTIALTAGKCYHINTWLLDYSGTISWMKLWIERGGARISSIQQYNLVRARGETNDLFLFENSLGGFDCAEFYGELSESDDHDVARAKFNDQVLEYDIEYNRTFKKNTGHIAREAERGWLKDFFASLQRWHIAGGTRRRIFVKNFDNESRPGELNESTFTFGYSKDDGTLNHSRS